eukprot:CAMPEP_0114566736 /NCGR_PEP_ID=MMETSP0114-20121206/15064_1 /TAXON_ID=31324 /ORGANISM="Goniomonas sp, Strain m" /LENGTH=287 /DNA_ID=CAMNT_0001753193 /DNA_START=24 /DNA_END=884 /DNA_ORIENTATION=-
MKLSLSGFDITHIARALPHGALFSLDYSQFELFYKGEWELVPENINEEAEQIMERGEDFDVETTRAKIGQALMFKFGSLQEAYNDFNTTPNQSMSIGDIIRGIKQLGLALAPELIEAAALEADFDLNGQVDFGEFAVNFQCDHLPPLNPEEETRRTINSYEGLASRVSNAVVKKYSTMLRCFKEWDRKSHGKLSRDDLRRGLRALDLSLADTDVRQLVERADPTSRGSILYRDFLQLFNGPGSIRRTGSKMSQADRTASTTALEPVSEAEQSFPEEKAISNVAAVLW